jgi:flagellar FliJ protein
LKRFTFRFQRILEIKERMEDARRAELGEVTAALNREMEQLSALYGTQATYRNMGSFSSEQRVDAGLLGISARYAERLKGEIYEQIEHIKKIEAVVENKRQKLLEATRERRVYEVLKERAEEAHRREANRRERIQLDEVGEQLYARRGSGRVEIEAKELRNA